MDEDIPGKGAAKRTSYVAPRPAPKGGSKTQNGRFSCKIACHLKKVCDEVSLCENCQRQRCKAFTGLFIRAKMVRGERPLIRENLAETVANF